ncbi:MAG: type II secretion system protein [Armatimonadota bacterium]
MRRGFTFVEFLTSVMIITILPAILFPVFARAREKARQASCVHNLLNIGHSLHQYAADYNHCYPPDDNNLEPLFYQYLPDRGGLDCPSTDEGYSSISGDYCYRGGYCTDDPTNRVLAIDRKGGIHNSGNNTLFNDGHAKWLTDKYIHKTPELASMPKLDWTSELECAKEECGTPPPQ